MLPASVPIRQRRCVSASVVATPPPPIILLPHARTSHLTSIPTRPFQNEYVTTTFDFDLAAPITGGTAYYSATLNGLGPFTSNAPLCDEVAKSGDPCPMGVGAHHQESTTQNTVSGKVVTTLTWYDQNDVGVLCAILTTKSS